jgi:hypothetical protein
MSQENVELVRRAFEASNRGGAEAVISEGFARDELIGTRCSPSPSLASERRSGMKAKAPALTRLGWPR